MRGHEGDSAILLPARKAHAINDQRTRLIIWRRGGGDGPRRYLLHDFAISVAIISLLAFRESIDSDLAVGKQRESYNRQGVFANRSHAWQTMEFLL